MAKLYFRYGAVGSAKTLNLLAVAHNYSVQKKKKLLLKPAMDDRFGKETIKSRAGLEAEADILVSADTDLLNYDYSGIMCVLVDEAQFLSATSINQLREISLKHNIPVICYGLRTDFRSHLFEGSKRLMEVADSIEEVKSTCFYCNRKAVMNLKYVNGVATVEGPVVDLGAEEKYHPTCYHCYDAQLTSIEDLCALKPGLLPNPAVKLS
ncbi:Thymidine kinase [Chlamydiales bacterium SCGC AG-110-M15]|nr:Thymidine kinase [Chlamydiales bacterium SCGC AG-110-M15]